MVSKCAQSTKISNICFDAYAKKIAGLATITYDVINKRKSIDYKIFNLECITKLIVPFKDLINMLFEEITILFVFCVQYHLQNIFM